MHLNIIGYEYRPWDGYGRFATYLAKALIGLGVDVHLLLAEQCSAPAWMHDRWGIDWSARAVSILPPFYLQSTPRGSGPHWLYTMTEGSRLPGGGNAPSWADIINSSNVERVIVPCQHNADAFSSSGVVCPVNVVVGGTEPDDFPLIRNRPARPYTFLTVADRGARKGWIETWQAFYKAFGGPKDTPDVRLIIKARPNGNEMLDLISKADNPDPRITIMLEDLPSLANFYRLGDCLVMVSRSEGFGMIMREGAMMGLPVITQLCSGVDDGYTHEWASVIEAGAWEAIPSHFDHIAGDWRKCDVGALAKEMDWHYRNPLMGQAMGKSAANWLRAHQTWEISCRKLLGLMTSEGV